MSEQSFIAYTEQVDSVMLQLYGIDTSDAGIDFTMLAKAQEAGQTAEEFVRWFGVKYGLYEI